MSRQARQRRRRRNRSGPSRIVFVGLTGVAGAIVIGVIAAVGYVLSVAQSAPSLDTLKPLLAGATSQVYAANGTRLGSIQSDVLRTPITTAQMPRLLRDATVSIEDQRFYENNGVDVTGIFRSAVKDVLHGEALQGASTITMQLMRNLYLGSDTHTFKQKVDEAKLAIEYNKHHSKQSILTNYLNSVTYGTVEGRTALGIEAASRIFFDKSPYQLNLQQQALLAGLPQAPSEYNPFLDPEAARQRRNEVLGKMAELHYITHAQAAAAQSAPLEVRHGNYYSRRQEDFFFEYVRQQLIKRYGLKTVEQGGLKVYTTIDLRMQSEARKAIAEILDEPGDPASAIVTIDPHNGDIEAMAESESYDQSQYNLAAQGRRQAGSTFKAIDLADALARGVDPNTTYYLSHTLEPGWLPGYPEYEVKTFENTSLNKSINLVQATVTSDNTVYAQLAADLGEETITQMAYKMGVKEHLESIPSEALGGLKYGVSPLEMANVYATLADGGYRNTPIAITKVVFPDGHVDGSWGKPHRVKVLSNGVTSEETTILHENVLGGTATRSAIDCPTAAKTGTTSEFTDAWLDGYMPNYSTSVWMGYPKKAIPMTDVHGEAQQGGYLAAEIWHTYMAAVTEGQPCTQFPAATEQISYQPFFGKFATTGRVSTSEPIQESGAPVRKIGAPRSKAPKGKGSPAEQNSTPGELPAGGGGGGGESKHVESPPVAPAPQPREPSPPTAGPTPKTPAPPVGGTGGAEPAVR
ncbi:MAG TPA: transglycosylase domain-containing protein [Solirubrobacteraceae bacterium]|jgi:penicillin-binding protein 1A|nr:transglycosylase domain-containing protein [Solirubrobacteraceae bacterium]